MWHDNNKRSRAQELALSIAGNVLAGLILYYVLSSAKHTMPVRALSCRDSVQLCEL